MNRTDIRALAERLGLATAWAAFPEEVIAAAETALAEAEALREADLTGETGPAR